MIASGLNVFRNVSRLVWLLVLVALGVSGCSGSATDRCRIDGVDPLLGQLAAMNFEIEGVPDLSEVTSATAASPEAFAGNELRCEVLFFNFDSREDLSQLTISSFLTFEAVQDSMEHSQERFDMRLDPGTEVWVGSATAGASAELQERCLTVGASGADEETAISAVLAAAEAFSVACPVLR